jgi:putative nucleotidyltransferase with HDIG domain
VGVSVAVVYLATRLAGPPDGSRASYLAWWASLSVAATVSLVAAGRLSRRLLPLVALMRLSLVFPDSAPSRFRTALRTGTVTTLEERLAAARRGETTRTPVAAAQLLLELVAHLDEHDPLTRGHSERVRGYAQSIGRELGLDSRALDLLNWAALLHDVGKLEVPHGILAKPGKPTEEEWEILRTHPRSGAELAAPLREWLGPWSDAIEQHHERWDGTGYPLGLAADEISLAGRIVAVADVFDVITSTRSYKRHSSVVDARKELLRCAGTQFDPEIVRAFLAISVRQSRLAAPLAWLAHAGMLARLPVTQASGLSAGAAAAAAAVAVGVGAGTADHPQPTTANPTHRIHEVAARPVAPRLTAAVSHRPPVARPKPKRKAAHPRPHPAATPEPKGTPTPPALGAAATSPAPPKPPEPAEPAAPKEPSAPAHAASAEPHSASTPAKPPAVGLPNASAEPPPVAPALVGAVTSTIDDVTSGATSAVQDATTLVTTLPPSEPVAAAPPSAPAPSPSPPTVAAPPDAPTSPPPPDSQGGSGGLLGGLLSLLDGLLPR